MTADNTCVVKEEESPVIKRSASQMVQNDSGPDFTEDKSFVTEHNTRSQGCIRETEVGCSDMQHDYQLCDCPRL